MEDLEWLWTGACAGRSRGSRELEPGVGLTDLVGGEVAARRRLEAESTVLEAISSEFAMLLSDSLLGGNVARKVEALVVRKVVEGVDSLVAPNVIEGEDLAGGNTGVELVLDIFEVLCFSNIFVPTAFSEPSPSQGDSPASSGLARLATEIGRAHV